MRTKVKIVFSNLVSAIKRNSIQKEKLNVKSFNLDYASVLNDFFDVTAYPCGDSLKIVFSTGEEFLLKTAQIK